MMLRYDGRMRSGDSTGIELQWLSWLDTCKEEGAELDLVCERMGAYARV